MMSTLNLFDGQTNKYADSNMDFNEENIAFMLSGHLQIRRPAHLLMRRSELNKKTMSITN